MRPLNCITPVVIKASELIKDITVKNVQWVKNFLRHPQLIQWLRKNMSKFSVISAYNENNVTIVECNVNG